MKRWIFGTLASVSVVASLTAVNAQERPEPQGPICSVTLERTQPDNVFDVTRQVFEDGSCNCFVYTGATTQRENVENRVTRILQERRCPDAEVMRVARGSGQGVPPSYPTSDAIVISVPATALFAAGVAIALDGPDSP